MITASVSVNLPPVTSTQGYPCFLVRSPFHQSAFSANQLSQHVVRNLFYSNHQLTYLILCSYPRDVTSNLYAVTFEPQLLLLQMKRNESLQHSWSTSSFALYWYRNCYYLTLVVSKMSSFMVSVGCHIPVEATTPGLVPQQLHFFLLHHEVKLPSRILHVFTFFPHLTLNRACSVEQWQMQQ